MVLRSRRGYRAFTLVEMLMVIMIIGMLGSMAIPRIAGGARNAAAATLNGDLAVVRKAIFYYSAEHGSEFPGMDADSVTKQLVNYSSFDGSTSLTRDATMMYGPYLVAIPACPVGPNKGSTKILIDKTNSPPVPSSAGGEGWIYNPVTGEFYANVGEIDQAGTALVKGS